MNTSQHALLTIKETALRLSVSRRTVCNLMAQRKLAFIKIGKALRFRPQDLDAFIEASINKPTGWKKAAHVG